MFQSLTAEERAFHEEMRGVVMSRVAPLATGWEIDHGFSRDTTAWFAEQGYLAGSLPKEAGGLGWDRVRYGLSCEALARVSVSFSGLFNVHTMVLQTLLKWGSAAQRQHILPILARGEKLGAIAFTEPEAGSDLSALTTTFVEDGDQLRITGVKKWVTCGAIADVVLVFGRLDEKPVAALVDTDTPGVRVIPETAMLGFRAAHVAAIHFDDCAIPRENLVGRVGSALMFLAPYALEYGRICVAWTAVGILRGCLEESCAHAEQREIRGDKLLNRGMIRTIVADMGVEHQAAWLLALHACRQRERGDMEASNAILAAKYAASRAAARQANFAVQVMGALGCDEHGPVARLFRDAKILEIIEGSNQVMQFLLAKSFAASACEDHSRFLADESNA